MLLISDNNEFKDHTAIAEGKDHRDMPWKVYTSNVPRKLGPFLVYFEPAFCSISVVKFKFSKNFKLVE